MFNSRQLRQPEPPKRTVWADKTKTIIDDIRKRRQELNDKLDKEEHAAKALCNHTFSDGTSAIENCYDYEYDRDFTSCSVCRQ